MPEGPEIKRSADAIAHQPITDIFFAFDHLKSFEDILKNILKKQIVTSVEPRDKALLTRFDHHLNIYSHNQLYITNDLTQVAD